ncbi:transcription factor ces-2 [Cylas formicarius]|uniref:transcription factor ces-2 n=1 Tax=Cylas formicarius TaxID=197179 RepID=UPI002958BC71|nr:transcription factor ces-2 [Cylas formicarius]
MDTSGSTGCGFACEFVNGQFLPVSTFSAYSLLRNCNYLLTTAGQDPHPKLNDTFITKNERQRFPAVEGTPGGAYTLPTHTKGIFAPTALINLPPTLHPLEADSLDNSTPVLLSPGLCGSGYRKQRSVKKPIPDAQKDDKYFERRRRNNQAAKKSRDARKMREDQIALKATLLEHENAILRAQVLTLREEASSLRQMLLQRKALFELPSREPQSQICLS